jgi:hypothetical protein
MQISIRYNLSNIPLDVKVSDTIGKIKAMLEGVVITSLFFTIFAFLDGHSTASAALAVLRKLVGR